MTNKEFTKNTNKKPTGKIPVQMAILLTTDYYSRDEIMEILSIKKTTADKYIHFLKQSGFKIQKYKNKFKILNFDNKINFTKAQTSLLAHILLLSKKMLPTEKNKILAHSIEKILCFSNQNCYDEVFDKYNLFEKSVIKSSNAQKINLYQQYLKEGRVLNVTLKNSQKLVLSPISYEYGANKIFFVFRDINTKQKIELMPDEISKMFPSDEILYSNNTSETIFELSGRLARAYVLKENERIIDVFENKLIIANSDSNREKLYRRLLRYDNLCRITHPKKHIKEFKKIIKNSLDNIVGFQDN